MCQYDDFSCCKEIQRSLSRDRQQCHWLWVTFLLSYFSHFSCLKNILFRYHRVHLMLLLTHWATRCISSLPISIICVLSLSMYILRLSGVIHIFGTGHHLSYVHQDSFFPSSRPHKSCFVSVRPFLWNTVAEPSFVFLILSPRSFQPCTFLVCAFCDAYSFFAFLSVVYFSCAVVWFCKLSFGFFCLALCHGSLSALFTVVVLVMAFCAFVLSAVASRSLAIQVVAFTLFYWILHNVFLSCVPSFRGLLIFLQIGSSSALLLWRYRPYILSHCHLLLFLVYYVLLRCRCRMPVFRLASDGLLSL